MHSHSRCITVGLFTLTLGVFYGSIGCAGDEPISPVSTGVGGHPGSPTSIPTTDAGPPKRTILQRNPFGDVAETENLLFDGDFEWSSPFSDEYGWYQGNSPTLSDVVVGPDCRSGIKCARLAKKQSVVGIAVASRTLELDVSVWVHFDDSSTACSTATGTVIDRLLGETPLNASDPDVHLTPSDAPDQAGWCSLTAIVPKRKNKAYLSIRNGSTINMLVDDAVMKAIPAPSTSASPPPPPPATWIPTAEEAASLDDARRLINEYDKPHDARKTEAQKAFEMIHQRGAL
jgi:hypothetical protein